MATVPIFDGFMVVFIDIWCQWVHWMSIFGQKPIFDVNWRQFWCKMIEKVSFCQFFRYRWPQYHFLMVFMVKTTIKTIKKCNCGHFKLKNSQIALFRSFFNKNWRQLTSKWGFSPKMFILCTHKLKKSMKTTIKTMKKWYCGHF